MKTVLERRLIPKGCILLIGLYSAYWAVFYSLDCILLIAKGCILLNTRGCILLNARGCIPLDGYNHKQGAQFVHNLGLYSRDE